ncbi:MAG: adenylate/guanylate cyclase domain-containing protein [Pseudomonadota bacterium]
MDTQRPEQPDNITTENSTGIAADRGGRYLPVLLYRKVTARLQRLHAAVLRRLRGAHERIQRMPLAFKFSFLITVAIVSCMLLLGTILVQQQSRQLEAQISEQGDTLARLMAKSAREPLLAEDKLALDSIASSFSNSSSVLGTAIATIEGELVTQAGAMFEERNPLTIKDVSRIIRSRSGAHIWHWTRLSGAQVETVMSFIQPISFQDVTAGYAMVTFSQAGMTTSLRQAIQTIVGATVLIIALGIAMSFALGRRITQPIDQLVHASHAIGNGEYTFRFKDCRKDEIGLLMEAFNEMAQGMLEKSQVKNALSRYVSPSVAREILSNLDDIGLSGKRVEGTVVFADIKGFTQISESIRPEDLVSILNRYFTLVTRACEINQGIVDKYMGDGVMLVFGAPEPDRDHAFHAVTCALLIQRLVEHENRLRQERNLFPVQFRIGINTGNMLAGNMGSRNRMEYTVVGDTVNLASRLCGITNANEIVISRDMYQRTDIRRRVLASEYQSIHLRGIRHPVSTYRVEGLTVDNQEILDRQFDTIIASEADEAIHA